MRTEQVIKHPQSSFHGQAVQLLWDGALAEQHPYQSTWLHEKCGRRSWDLLDLGILSLQPNSWIRRWALYFFLTARKD